MKPALRSLAGAEPVVPCSSTMLTVSVLSLYASASHCPAFLPSSMKSEPRKVLYRLVSLESTARSVRMTGILAFLASLSTVSQPDSTTGEKAMTSTRCWMYDRMALIWFSCFCWASENFRSMPALLADSWIDLVLAVRQPLSAPTWAKPMVILPFPAPSPDPPEPHPATAMVKTPAKRSAEIFLIILGGVLS